MRRSLRSIGIAFAMVAGGIMAANLLTHVLTPNYWLMFPVWVMLCMIPAYWYGHRLGIVSYAPWEILGTIGAVLAAIIVVQLWALIQPLSAVALAALVCAFFLLARRWLDRRW